MQTKHEYIIDKKLIYKYILFVSIKFRSNLKGMIFTNEIYIYC
jgi:hypothetical protein